MYAYIIMYTTYIHTYIYTYTIQTLKGMHLREVQSMYFCRCSIYIYIYIYICVYIYVSIYLSIYLYVSINTYTYQYMYIYKYIHIHIYIYLEGYAFRRGPKYVFFVDADKLFPLIAIYNINDNMTTILSAAKPKEIYEHT
jgi:hypothetical protein